jgi:hypothetical protein
MFLITSCGLWLEFATIIHATTAPRADTCALSVCRPRTNEVGVTACVACAAVESVHPMGGDDGMPREANSNPRSLIFVSLLHLYDVLVRRACTSWLTDQIPSLQQPQQDNRRLA